MILMNKVNSIVRLPAEWETSGAVMLAWPHENTDWCYMLPQVRACFEAMVEAIVPWSKVIVVAPDCAVPRCFLSRFGDDRVFYFQCDTNDTWARDFGPITVETSSGAMAPYDFRFNGWGMKFAACHDNLVTAAMHRSGLLRGDLIQAQDFVLEGGGIESDGAGLLMTTAACQLSPNRNPWLTEGEIKDALCAKFGAQKVIWLRHGYLAGDDTDSHIDTLARFAPGNTIVYTGCDDSADEHFNELTLMERELKEATGLDGSPFNLFRLPLPDAIYDEDGNRLPATYANFLALPHAVIMPVYGQPKKDELARRILQVAYEAPVVTVDCRALIRQHGSLHCMTMQIPDSVLAL